jgi:hypothetical protein
VGKIVIDSERLLETMKVIIAGSRQISNYQVVVDVLNNADIVITQVVSGAARGVDKLGERWAIENNIPIKQFLPDWSKYGRSAGYIRNEQMAKYAEGLVAIWDGYSRGTGHMIDLARKHRLVVHIHNVRE